MILTAQGTPAILEAVRNNWYEASRWSPNRSWIWFPVQDARKDLDRFTRYELSKHARYLYKNSPLIRGLIERLVTLTMGSGFHPTFKSESNSSWQLKAKAWWKKRSRNIHLGPKASFSQYSRAVCRARFLDGECFTVKTFDETSYQNRVQGIEANRVTGGTDGDKDSIDGIVINKQNIPIAYKFRDEEESYSAEHVIHHFTPNRLMQFRGETVLAAAINTARDVDDILALEKECVKDASSKKDVIKTSTGELNQEAWRGLRYSQNFPTVFNLPADDRTKDDYYRIRFGSQPVVLKTGDEYTPYKPDRPGAAWQGFMDFLANTICLSSGFPASVVLPLAIGGTDIRRDLDIAQRVVETIQLDIAAELDEIIFYLIEPEIFDGELKGAPDDWRLVWHFPQRINVDRQTAQQDRLDVQSGLMSKEEYHGRYSEDGDAYEETVIEEVKKRKERISQAGFKDVQEFVQLLALEPKMFMNKQAEDAPGTASSMKDFPAWLKLVKGHVDKDDDEEVEMMLHEPVGWSWENGGISARDFGHILNSIPRAKKIKLTINSLGGSVSEGIAMHNMLLARKNVTTCVIGYAASMASVIAQAGSVRMMMPGTMMIIHNPHSAIEGDHREMEAQSNFLKQVKDSLVDVYANRTGLGKRVLSEMMDETTVMDGPEAKKLGFCDEVAEGSPAYNEFSPARFATAYREIIATNKIPQPKNQPKPMVKLIAALAALTKLPADATDEVAAPQVEAAVNSIIAERDALKTENQKLKDDNKKHEDAKKTRVTNRVQKAIDDKLVKAERKDALVAAGLNDESALDFLNDIVVVDPKAPSRGAKPVSASNSDSETEEAIRASFQTCANAVSGSDQAVAIGVENAKAARKLREMRGHKGLFATAAK